MPRRRLRRLFAVLAAAALFGPAPAGAAEPGCAPRLRAALNVGPAGAPLVTLTINGAPAHLLLDTGAERTTLTEAAARRLGLPADFGHAGTMRGVGGDVAAGEVRPDLLGAGGHRLAGASFAVVPVHLPKIGDEAVDGLLGADMLRAYDLDLDIGHHLILLYDPPACALPALPWKRAYAALDARLSRHRHMAFPVTLDGRRLTAFIDTGAEISLIDTGAARRFGLTPAALVLDAPVMMQGVSTQAITAREHRFARLGMARAILLAPTVAVTPLRLDDADLMIGTDMLARTRIWLSYATSRIYVALPE